MEIVGDIIFLSIGLGSTVAGLLLFRNVYCKFRTWKTVPGTVIGYREDEHVNRSSYCPQVEFIADDGRMITFTSSTGSDRRPYRIGASVKVLCPPDDPANATIKSFSNLFLLPIIAICFGAAFTIMGLGVILFGK